MGVKIIYEDKDILAVNKPWGVNTHPDARNRNSLIQEMLKIRPEIKDIGEDKTRPGVVHRLDKNTSGVLILAKNQKSFEYLKNLFKSRQIKKTYTALLIGKLGKKAGERGIINMELARSVKNPILRTAKGETRGALKSAITEYKIINYFELAFAKEKKYFTLIEAYPKTGRTHQIRAHFKALNHPVAGDALYGNKKINDELNAFGLTRQALHALSLEFTLPSGGRIKIEAGLPYDLKNFLEKLKKQTFVSSLR